MANVSYTGTSCIDDSEIIFISVEGLLTGKTYQDYDLTCITIDFSSSSENNITKSFLYGPYDDCSECSAPFSAGTETKICVVSNCDPLVSVLIDVPHPTWTNEYGKAVVQLNMIELGGMNGLNS